MPGSGPLSEIQERLLLQTTKGSNGSRLCKNVGQFQIGGSCEPAVLLGNRV